MFTGNEAIAPTESFKMEAVVWRQAPQARARNRALSLLLKREAFCLCIRPLLAALSMAGTATLYASLAALLSPESRASMTFLTWVRIMERMLALLSRRLSFCRARFRDWDELATESPQLVAGERREMILDERQKSKK